MQTKQLADDDRVVDGADPRSKQCPPTDDLEDRIDHRCVRIRSDPLDLILFPAMTRAFLRDRASTYLRAQLEVDNDASVESQSRMGGMTRVTR